MAERLPLRETVSGDFGPHLAQYLTPTLLKEIREGSPRYQLVTRIEAIHEKMSRNFVNYTERVLRGNPRFQQDGQLLPTGVYSWTSPYPKPVLRHHDHHTDPIGRVASAEYATKTRAGVPGIVVTAHITDPDGIEKVRDGRYLTVSIGAVPSKLTCSVCGADVTDNHPLFNPHDHQRGKTYDGKLAYVEPENLWFDELSFVNSPGDTDAQVVDPGDLVAFEMVLIDTVTREVADLGRARLLEVAPEVLLTEGAFERDISATLVTTIPFASRTRGGKPEMPEGVSTPPAAQQNPPASPDDKPQTIEIPEDLQEDPEVAGLIEIVYQQQDDIEELEQELKAATEREEQSKQALEQIRAQVNELLKLYAASNDQGTAGAATISQSSSTVGGAVVTQFAVDASLQAAHEQALERIAELESKLRTFLAEQIVQARIALGRLPEAEAPSKVPELAQRSVEVLEELYEELKTELAASASKPAAPPAPIEPPASVKQETLTPVTAPDKPKDLNAYSAFKKLLAPRR